MARCSLARPWIATTHSTNRRESRQPSFRACLRARESSGCICPPGPLLCWRLTDIPLPLRESPMKRVNSILSIATALIILHVQPSLADSTAQADGTIHIPAFDLPESSLLNKETRTALKDIREHDPRLATAENGCPSMEGRGFLSLPLLQSASGAISRHHDAASDRWSVHGGLHA